MTHTVSAPALWSRCRHVSALSLCAYFAPCLLLLRKALLFILGACMAGCMGSGSAMLLCAYMQGTAPTYPNIVPHITDNGCTKQKQRFALSCLACRSSICESCGAAHSTMGATTKTARWSSGSGTCAPSCSHWCFLNVQSAYALAGVKAACALLNCVLANLSAFTLALGYHLQQAHVHTVQRHHESAMLAHAGAVWHGR